MLMAGFFDVDLIRQIPQVDKKVRLVGLYKRREREKQKSREERPKDAGTADARQDSAADSRTIDITV
jgi:hypothetical protein